MNEPLKQKPKKQDFPFSERLGIPIVFLGSVYGAYDMMLKAITIYIERRDAVLNIGKKPGDQGWISPEHGKLIFETELIGQWIGICMFIIGLAFGMYFLPKYILSDDRVIHSFQWKRWSALCFLFLFFALFSQIYTGIDEFKALCSAISTAKPNSYICTLFGNGPSS